MSLNGSISLPYMMNTILHKEGKVVNYDENFLVNCPSTTSGVNFMSKKLGVKIPPGRISPNFVKNFPHAFLLEDRFLLDLGKIYSLLKLMKLAPG